MNKSACSTPSSEICVRMTENPEAWEKAIEGSRQAGTASDVQIVGKKCADMGVRERSTRQRRYVTRIVDRTGDVKLGHGIDVRARAVHQSTRDKD